MMRREIPLKNVLQAHRRIAPHVQRTPMVHSRHLSALTGGEIWLKLECWQPTGSFKVRGALNKVGLLTAARLARGLVTGSAGNHGLGVAYAAQVHGLPPPDIFVPATTPRAKLEKLSQLPATLHTYGETYEDAHQAAQAYARETGTAYIPAYDDLDIIAGQGTIAVEILSDLPDTDRVLVPIGGGGLVAGIASAARAIHPGCAITGVQAEASPSALLSLRDGMAYDPFEHAATIADGLAGGFGTLPFELAAQLIDRVMLASESDLRRAIYTLLDREQLVVEASGAAAIAPLINGNLDVSGQIVVGVLSGGNLDTILLKDILIELAP